MDLWLGKCMPIGAIGHHGWAGHNSKPRPLTPIPEPLYRFPLIGNINLNTLICVHIQILYRTMVLYAIIPV